LRPARTPEPVSLPTATAGDGASYRARIDALIAKAHTQWEANDIAGALAAAEQAYQLAARLLGPNDPKTAEVKAQIDAARQAAGEAGT